MQPYFILDENAQYYECAFSCDNAIVMRVEEARFFITDSRYTLEAKQGAVSAGVITGFGAFGYHLALMGILQIASEVQAYKAQQTAQAQQQ